MLLMQILFEIYKYSVKSNLYLYIYNMYVQINAVVAL